MQTYTVLWTDDALKDFDRIIGHISNENRTNAANIYQEMKNQAISLEQFPLRGRVVPELEALGFTHYRELLFKRWRIIYTVDGTTVYILLLLDGRQNLEDQLIYKILHSGQME